MPQRAVQVLEELLAGNQRFAGQAAPEPAPGPVAAVLTCADARIIPDRVFSRTLGELFVVRIAGNFASKSALASIQFAVDRMGTSLVIVLGHDDCGAVTAVYNGITSGQPLPGYLEVIERNLRPTVASAVADGAGIDEAAAANVKAVARRIAESSVVKPLVGREDVLVVGAMYRVKTGDVDIVSG